MTDRAHPELELQDLLDGRLDREARARIESHLSSCAPCREEFDALRYAREAVRSLPRLEAPAALVGDVADSVRPVRRRREGPAPPSRRRVLVFGLAAAAAAIIGVYVRRRDDLPAAAIRAAATPPDAAHGSDLKTSDPIALERFFASRLPFHVRVYDLGMMQYRLVGGRVADVASHASAMYSYAGPGGTRLTCEMYRGDVSELPEPDERRDHNGLVFFVYKRDATTAVFWQEGDVTCAAISDMATADVVAIAVAKAIKA
jgi:anti-sigma factor RsiW